MLEPDAAVRDHRAQAEPGRPLVNPAGALRRALDGRAQVVPELTQLADVRFAHAVVTGILAQAVGTLPGVIGDQPAVEQFPDLLQVSGRRLATAVLAWSANHLAILPVAAKSHCR
jgi:hypothetical protein